nr:hypothetical protein [Tanacetum cinerariifolium]
VVIKDTPDVLKKKTPVQTQKHKGMKMLSDVALLEEAQIKMVIKRSKQETRFQHQAGGSSDGAGSQPEVPDEPKGKFIDTSKGVGSRPEVFDVSKVMSSDQESENESWGVVKMMMMMTKALISIKLNLMMKELNLMMIKVLILIEQMMKKKHKKMSSYILLM